MAIASPGLRNDSDRPLSEGTSARPNRPPGSYGLATAHTILVLWAIVSVLPLLWAILSSLKADREILSSPLALPAGIRLDNFGRAWEQAHIGQYFLNTLIVVVLSLAGTLITAAMAAYVFARFTFRFRRFLYYFFIAGMAFPMFMALVPLFFVVKNVGMLNSHLGLILVYIAYSLPFSIFFMTSFFRTLPQSVAEAAILDGASQWRLFWAIMLPMARPGLISIGIFNFIGQWNQYLLPLVLVQDESKYVIAQGLANLAISQGYKNDISGLFAGLTIAIVPILVVYVVFQRKVQSGMTAGALK